jgi:hypothetical protein
MCLGCGDGDGYGVWGVGMEMDMVAVAVVVVVVVMSKNTQRVKQELVCIMRGTLYVLFYSTVSKSTFSKSTTGHLGRF